MSLLVEGRIMAKIKYVPTTLADTMLPILNRLSACKEAMEHYNKFAGGNLLEMVESTQEESWAVWYLAVLGKNNDTILRKKMMLKITSPMVAFVCYIRFAWLTDEEDKLLEDKFKGKLPTAEKELQDGIVQRAKWL